MSNKLIALLTSFLCFTTGFGQDFNQYQLLRCEGPVPESFLIPSSQKFEAELANISRDKTASQRKTEEQFYLQSNFSLDDLLHSGMVLFNDPVSNYIREVAEELLKDEQALLDSLSFYALRSSAVNAFATDQGYIFITMGMLSQMESEGQLAFVLSHEIAHFEKKHALNLYLTVDELESEYNNPRQLLRATGFSDWELAKSHFSKEHELEADSTGLLRFIRSSYDLKAVNEFFDILKYSHLPFDLADFDKSFFESPTYRFPEKYINEDADDGWLKPRDDKDDSRSTHPNIGKRVMALEETVKSTSREGRKRFIVSEERFYAVQKIARFELVHYYLHDESYYEAIYAAYVLLQKDPENVYLRKSIAKALNCLAKYRSTSTSFPLPEGGTKYTLSGLSYFLHKMDAEEISVLAVHYAWQLHLDHPEDEGIQELADDAMLELIYQHERELADYTLPLESQPDSLQQPEDAQKELTRSEKLRREHGNKYSFSSIENKYMQSAFNGLQNSNGFSEAFKNTAEKAKNMQERKAWYASAKGKRSYEKETKKKERKGRRMGLDNLLIVNPFYIKVKTSGKKEEVNLLASESARMDLEEMLQDNANLLDLNVDFLNTRNLSASSSEQFNEIVVLNDWLLEQMNFEDLTITPGHRQQEVRRIAEKYGTKYIAWTGVINMQKKRSEKILYIILGLAYPPTLPLLAWIAFKKQHRSLLFFMVYNIETGGREVVKFEYMKSKDRKDLLNAHLYDALLQIQTPPAQP